MTDIAAANYSQMSTPAYWAAGPQAELPVVPAGARLADGVLPSLDRAPVDRLIAIGAQTVAVGDVRFGHVETGAPLTPAHRGQVLRFVLDTMCQAALTPKIAKARMLRDVPQFDERATALLRAGSAVGLEAPAEVRACFTDEEEWSGEL